MAGAEHKKSRLHLYGLMSDHMDDPDRLRTQNRLVTKGLGPFADFQLRVDKTDQYDDVLEDILHVRLI